MPEPESVSPSADPQVDLLPGLLAGDAAACERFVRARTGPALLLARRFLDNEADAHEAVQDAFLSFFRALPTFRVESSLTTWLHRIVVNAARMKRRARRRRPESSIDELLPRFDADGHRKDVRACWASPALEQVETAELRALVQRKIAELPESYRNVIMLRDIQQLDTCATAELLGESPGAVKVRLHRARQALRTLLERERSTWEVNSPAGS